MTTRPQDSTSSPLLVHSKSTLSRHLSSLFAELLPESLQLSAQELIRKRRVLDFMVQPGSVSVKVHEDNTTSVRAELCFSQLSDADWEKVFSYMAEHSYFLSMLLSSQITSEMEEAFRRNNTLLFPDSSAEITLKINSQEPKQANAALAALMLKFLEKVEQDPFIMFLVRGRGREETLLELRRRRAMLKAPSETSSLLSHQEVAYESVEPLSASLDRYWSCAPRLFELSYTIKADELPASLLKWLDPLPLGGLEEELDWVLEAAYEKITRLAQGFGLRI